MTNNYCCYYCSNYKVALIVLITKIILPKKKIYKVLNIGNIIVII